MSDDGWTTVTKKKRKEKPPAPAPTPVAKPPHILGPRSNLNLFPNHIHSPHQRAHPHPHGHRTNNNQITHIRPSSMSNAGSKAGKHVSSSSSPIAGSLKSSSTPENATIHIRPLHQPSHRIRNAASIYRDANTIIPQGACRYFVNG